MAYYKNYSNNRLTTRKRNSRYSDAQRKAFYSGQGFRVAYQGLKINFRNPETRASFEQGWRAAGKKIAQYPQKYVPLKKPAKQ